MPLDADEEAVGVDGFGGFDDAIGALGDETESFAETADGLVVKGVHFEFGFAENFAEARIGFEGDFVSGDAVADAEFGRDVLDEGVAVGDVDPLTAEADSKEGFVGLLDPG